MKEKLETIIDFLTGPGSCVSETDTININDQLRTEEEDDTAIARNLNASFLISLSLNSHPLYHRAVRCMDDLESHPSWKKTVTFYREGINHVHNETTSLYSNDKSFREELDTLYSWINIAESCNDHYAAIENIHRVFFQEGVSLCKERQEKIDLLRK